MRCCCQRTHTRTHVRADPPSLPVYKHVETQACQHSVFELWIFVHDDGNDADVRQESSGPTHHVFPAQPVLSGRVQTPVVHAVVVTLCEELDAAVFLLVELQHPMHYRDVSSVDLKKKERIIIIINAV